MQRAAFHFAGFVVSRARRQLLRDGCELPLIPRYFDLLLLLIERRHEAVHRRELLDCVWSEVVVSDNALNQAVRTLRRILGDDPRQPTFIRTATRHGYQFVYADVREVEELAPTRPMPTPVEASAEPHGDGEFDRALSALLSHAPGADSDDRRRDAAETLLRLDAVRARRELELRDDSALALATLRDARWDVAGAPPVPFLGHAGMWRSGWALACLRLDELWTLARRRWIRAVLGGSAAGTVAGAIGGSALWLGPGATGGAGVLLVLPILGAILGGLGAVGVAGGLTLAELAFRAARAPALIAGGAAGGAAIGATSHGLAALLLQGLFGKDLSAIAGGFEGLSIGAAVGIGYALATPRRTGGLATPAGVERIAAALLAGAICGLTTGLLAWQGSPRGDEPRSARVGVPRLGGGARSGRPPARRREPRSDLARGGERVGGPRVRNRCDPRPHPPAARVIIDSSHTAHSALITSERPAPNLLPQPAVAPTAQTPGERRWLLPPPSTFERRERAAVRVELRARDPNAGRDALRRPDRRAGALRGSLRHRARPPESAVPAHQRGAALERERAAPARRLPGAAGALGAARAGSTTASTCAR